MKSRLASEHNISSSNKKDVYEPITDPVLLNFVKRLNLMKSSSNDNNGLLNRLSVCLCLVNQIGQTRAIAQLWREFLLELRYRYDSSVPINGLNSGDTRTTTSTTSSFKPADAGSLVPPDLARCLLHQKLQMLNCCIRKKIDRKMQESSVSKSKEEDEEEDEFFDCEDPEFNLENSDSTPATGSSDTTARNKSTNPNSTPEGRLKKFGNLTLLNRADEPIYIPITQVNTKVQQSDSTRVIGF
jgi:hypothetical protein